MKQIRKRLLSVLLICVLFTVSACHTNPTQEQLYSRLFDHFEKYGFSCLLQPMPQDQPAPIYKASAWQTLRLNGEEVLLYFDDSNRADYLSGFVDTEEFGSVWRFGLRFVLVYDGDDPAVLEALNAIENE